MTAVRSALVEGLFLSALQPSQHPSVAQARHAALVELKTRTIAGCACDVAAEYGDHPDTATARLLWCCTLVGGAA